MSIMSYTGGTVVAMAGKECVCIGSDLRTGEQMTTLSTNEPKMHKLADKIYVCLGGFESDAKTVLDLIEYRKSLYELRENRKIKPQVLGTILSNLLYQRRFGSYFVQPLVAGLHPYTHEPYICGMDNIGCICAPEDFIVTGTGEEYLLGVCEGFWQKDMGPDDLFEATSQSLLAALERDAASGWGAVVYTITKDSASLS